MEEKLKGNVKSTREITYNVAKKSIISDFLKKIEKLFSTPDVTSYRKSETDEVFKKGSVKKRIDCIYDKNNNLVEEIWHNNYKRHYKYDDKNNVVELVSYYDGKEDLDWKETCKYDDKNNVIELISYDGKGNIKNKETYQYKYDNKNNILETICISDDSEEKITYKYDDRNNMIEEIEYWNGEYEKKVVLKYDERNNMIEKIVYDSEKNIEEKSVFKYDMNNNLIEDELCDSEEIDSKTIYKYDSKNNRIEETYVFFKGNIQITESLKTAYDHYGNWVKQIKFENDKPCQITEREIIYYD